ncbi:MAG TPA: M48 family metalloprotease [Candidatus Acidoferrales bacterium]|nr:M48 family metalloprotease [Candidatus Acidoferrales bacterium]
MEATRPARNFGPANPETFFAAQKRNRRATWRMSALCTFAAFIMGIPLTLVLTPLLYTIGMVVLETLNHFSPQPELLQQANDLAKLGLRVADYVINQKGTLNPGELTAGLMLVLLPGMAVALGLWFAMLALFRHGGVGGTLASMNAREPNPADLKELQLADVAQEMAIAAGLPAPKIMLVDSIGANAAAVGSSAHDAHIVISRRLLDDLDRDQMQAILAHLVGSIGNGDLGIAFTVTSVFETCGLLVNLVNAPFSKESRGRLWHVARYMLGGGTPEKRAADAAEIAESLATSLDGDTPDMDQYFKKGNPGLIKKAYRLVVFPLMFTNMAVEITLWFFLNLLLGPCMAMLWRTRRYLADASSVELTRNPDALARALQCLSEDNTAFDSGDWATHLFVVNPKGDTGLRGQQPSQQQMAKAIQAWASTAHIMPAQDAANLYDIPVVARDAAGVAENDWSSVRQEIITTVKAAAMGNPQAMARMRAMAEIMGERLPAGLGELPNFIDIQAASHGDMAAIQRLKQAQQGRRQTQPKRGQSGLQMQSFVSFHPPLVKRAKRLQKMGSHMIAPVRGGGWVLTVFMTLLYVIIVPLLTVAGGLMLIVIAMLIGMNLMLLAVWLTAIHWFFVWLNGT